MRATFSASSGRLAMNHSTRVLSSGSFSSVSRVERFDREDRDDADGRADLERDAFAGRQVELIVVELVLRIPQADPGVVVVALRVHRVGDVEEVLEELVREVLVDRIVTREFDRDRQHVERVDRHPRRAVGLRQVAAGRQLRAAVEHPDVVEPEEAALKDVAAGDVLAVHPPGEVEQQLLKDAFEERHVAAPAAPLRFDLVDAVRGPRVHRRVDVVERPLVGRQLTVRMHVALARQRDELALGEIRIDQRERDDVKGQIPAGVPRVLPLVGHREHLVVVEVRPTRVASVQAARRRRRHQRIALEPIADDVVVELLRPQQPGERAALDRAIFLVGASRATACRRTRRLPRCARSTIASNSTGSISSVPGVSVKRKRIVSRRAGLDHRDVLERRFRARCAWD